MTKPRAAGRTDRQLFGWLWRRYLRPHTAEMVIAMTLMAVEGGTMGFLSYMIKPMFDDVFLGENQDALFLVGLVMLGIFLVRATTSVLQKVIMARVSQRTMGALQKDLLAHLMQLDSAFHQRHSPGYLISRVQTDAMSIGSLWNALIAGAGRDVVALISLFSVAIWIDWRWTLVALIGAPFLVAPTLIAQRKVRKNARNVQELTARMTTRLDEVFHGINPVKLNLLEAYQSKRYGNLVDTRVTAGVKQSFWTAMMPGLIDVATGVGFMGVLYYGGREIVDGTKTIGDFMAFFTALGLAFEPMRRLGAVAGMWQTAAAGIERIVSLFDTRPELDSPDTLVKAEPVARLDLELRDVTLSYGDLPVLRGLSFIAEAGKTTALVGASGAGKSTVFNLLTRLVDPQGGQVLVGGAATDTLPLEKLRGLFSVVSQEALLFDETLRENILLGRTDVDDATLNSALETANAHSFVANMPEGLETLAGPRGSNLSGGQRQRIAIARAVLRDRPVLLLDEATSALDAQSESYVQEALERLAKGRTTLVIAHRLSTIKSADKIVVMDQGRVVDQGTHEELLSRGGIYADLHKLQIDAT